MMGVLVQMAGWIREVRRRSVLLYYVAIGNLILLAMMAALAGIDPRSVMGLNPWIKPIKFALSIAIYSVTFAWLLEYLRVPAKTKSRLTGIVALAMIIEIACIAGQAARGVQSHFNLSSLFNAMIFALMGFAITVNTVAAAYVGVKFWISDASIEKSYLWGIRLGFLIFVAASLEGFAMAGHLGHGVGVADGGAGLPFVNWSTRGGDLRASHFLGLHALQVLPLCGHFSAKLWNERRAGAASICVIALATAYGAIVVLLFAQAMAGQPLFRIN